MYPLLMSFIVVLISAVIFLSIFIPIRIVRKKYINFVIEHSVALKQIEEINKQYKFKKIPNMDMEHSYDNENMYDDISCEDYLIYQLAHDKKKAVNAIIDADNNKIVYKLYLKQIKEECVFNEYGTEQLLPNIDRLEKYEKQLFKEKTIKPRTKFSISVTLELTSINDRYRDSKYEIFYPEQIEDIIHRLEQKRGSFYLDEDIWKSICRVERGKVTNKMRFAIYERDHYRCQKCGKKRDDLEIDHIIPIAKGGKSTFDNLQTLCHKCNTEKGTKIEYYNPKFR